MTDPSGKPGRPTIRIGSYTRTDGTRVRAHNRRSTMKQIAAAWASTGASGLISLALILELGFGIITLIFVILTALLTWLSVVIQAKATAPKRRVKAKARKTTNRRPSSTKRRTTRR